jgi:C-terminal processing protease CtpA/Prc
MFEYHVRDNPPKILKAASSATWFDKYVAIKKFTGRVRILVNGQSFSGAEIFAKVMQSHGRAKIYGTQTAGAFYATLYFNFKNIGLNLPFAKLIDTVTKVNADGVGVTPDFTPTTSEYISLIFNDIVDNNFNSF